MKKIFTTVLLTVLTTFLFAQGVANYGVTRNTGVTYTSISGTGANFGSSWRNGTDTDDNLSATTPIGFTFTYLGVPYTQFCISTNGFITFNVGTAATGFSGAYGFDNTQFSTVAGSVTTLAPFYDDNQTAGNGDTQAELDASMKYLVTGAVGNRVLTIEWINMQDFSTTSTSSFNFQIKLYEANSRIEYNYGTMSFSNSSTLPTRSYSLGINNTTISGTPTVAELLTQQIVNTTTFNNTPSNALGGAVATNMPADNSQIVFTALLPCTTPTDQPTSLNLTPLSTSISGTFTAATSNPTNYLVVRTTTAVPPSAPVDGITYTPGTSALGGVIVSNGTTTSFNATGLTPLTTYYFWVYSFNAITCTGGPLYLAASPLTASATTTSCSGLSGTYSVGPTGAYTSLTAALAAANLGVAGPTIFELQATYVSTVETFPLTISLFPCGSGVNTVTIRPATGATGLVISSNNTTATIDFNTGSFVTIDGRPGGVGTTRELQIINTTTTAPTIRFINDASNNTIIRCDVRGAASTQGVITLAATTITTGNDNNTFDNNLIRDNGVGFPTNGIYSLGQSATILNDNNTVTSNEIFNYFNASNASSGININSNNNAWTVNGNYLYQTANRTYTSAITNSGISVLSGSGYTITSNIIGYANNGQTGTTNMIGLSSGALGGTFPSAYTVGGVAVAIRYNAISCAFTLSGANSTIAGNIIGGFAMYTSSGATGTSGIFGGIAVTSGNATIGSAVIPNIIGATSGNGAIYTATTTTGGQIVGIYTTSANTITIQNNSIGALDAMGTSATLSGGIIGINVAGTGPYSVVGNTIGNTTSPNLRMGNLTTGANLSNVGTTFGIATGTAQFNGILNANTAIGGIIGTLISPNTIRNASLNSSSTTASIRGITSAGTPSIIGNNINNLTTTSTNAGVASTLLAGMGIFLNSISTNGAIVANNTINTLSLSNTTATGTNLCGIAVYAGTTDIYKNRIYDLVNASTSTTAATPGTASGIFLRQPAGVQTIYNNMISLGNGQTTNTSFNGLWLQNSVVAYTLNAYYNSINIEGVAASGAQPSFCFNRGSYSATTVTIGINLLDNIFNNSRTGGTGQHFAIGNCYGATAVNTGWPATASNFNVLNSASAATVGYWTTAQTIAAWRTSSGGDASSLSGVPVTFTNSAIGDLHLNFGVTPTQIESGGTTVAGFTTDYDNDTRPGPVGSVNGGGIAPDMGADETDAVPLDLIAPQITYTPLTFTCNTGDRIFTATIVDVTGVPASGALQPRVYYRKNAGAWFSSQGTLSAGTNKNGTWTFTIIAADMGGLAVTDNVQYYVIAQDLVTPTPNIISNPSAGLVATDVNTVTTAPTTPNSYSISPTLTGTYTVGAAGTYTTLAAAINAYNTSCIGGPVIFSLIDAAYITLSDTIKYNPSASAINTLTIKPTLPNTVINGNSGTVATGVLVLFGADYVTIDGSISNTVNTICPPVTASRDLTINNISTNTSSAVVTLNATAAGKSPTNNIIKNCNVAGNTNVITLVGINNGGTGIASGAGANFSNNNSIINNNVSKAVLGIFTAGSGLATKNSNTIISQNLLNTAFPNNIGRFGIMALLEDNIAVTGNTVDNIVNTASVDAAGISIGANGAYSTTAVTGGEVTNALISNNTVGIVQTTSTFSAVGICLLGTTAGTNSIIANNMVYGVAANSTAGDIGVGILVTSGTAPVKVYHNTVSMQGTIQGATAASQISSCFAVVSATPIPLDLRNNIFSNTQLGNAGATLRQSAIALGYASPYTGLLSNYNDLYSAGAGPGTYTVGVTGGLLGTNRTTLAAWQTETGGDANSINVLPVFTSATDLHLTTANCGLDNKGTNLSIPLDFDCQTRDAITPDLGADEFSSTASNTLYNAVGTTITDTRTVTGLEIFRAPNCERFAALLPNGGSPVTGSVTARVYKYATVQTYNAEPYVQRVIDITPASSPATKTGRVTLYYTQQEFDDFNTASGPWPDLPTGPADVIGIANLRITKYGGTPNTTPSSPNMYSAGTYLYINPADPDIVWNAVDSRWEVTVDVTGFSGFYVHTNSQYALPITFNYLNGVRQGTNHLLNWKVTCTGSPTATLILERSGDNRTFTAINNVTATALRCQDPFNYTDANPLLGLNYYRVKIIDAIGRITYGNTIALLNAVKGFEVLNVAPNPVTSNGAFKLNVSAAKAETIGVIITDMQGRTIERKQVNIIGGYNAIPMDISKLAAGTYNVQVTSSIGDKSKVLRVVKQ
jgi:hypothetical protein